MYKKRQPALDGRRLPLFWGMLLFGEKPNIIQRNLACKESLQNICGNKIDPHVYQSIAFRFGVHRPAIYLQPGTMHLTHNFWRQRTVANI